MVAFLGGKPAKKWYRKFSVRGVVGQDDFAMMEEVVGRRFAHDEDFGGMPDLVLIDGGKGQLSSAAAAMRAAGREDVPLLSLAKERVRGGEKVFRERVFLPGRKNPLHLPPNDPVLHLLMRVRDEAHRFAVTFHRSRRTRAAFCPPPRSSRGARSRSSSPRPRLRRLGGAGLRSWTRRPPERDTERAVRVLPLPPMDHPFRGQGPLYLLLLAFLAGFLLGLAAGPAGAAVSGVLLLAALGLASFRFREIPLACAVAALCGSLTAGRVPLVAPGSVLPYIDNEALLDGVVEEVRATDSGWAAAAHGSVVSLPGGTKSIRLGTVLLYIRNPDRSVSFPARVRAAGRLHPVRGMGNPGEIPREWAAMAQGAQYAFSADAAKVVFLPEAAGADRWRNPFPRARRETGEWVKRVAGTTNGSLYLLSLATGEVPPYSHPMVTLLRRTGLAHLLAISGVNVAIFHIITVFLLRAAMWAFRRRHGTPDLNLLPPLLALPASWAYVFLAGAPTPAVRSAGMITIAVLLWRRLGVRAPGIAWTGMLLLTLAASPTEIVSPSFLLSYGATFFLIANYGAPPEEGEGGWRTRAAWWVKEAVVAATVAFLGTLPVSAAFFQAVPSGAILWNVLFGPILGTAGVAGAAVAVVGGAFGVDPLAPAVRVVADGLTVALSLLDRLSGSGAGCFPVPPSGIAWPALSMAAAVAGTILLLRRGRRPWPATVLSAALFLGGIHAPYAALPGGIFPSRR